MNWSLLIRIFPVNLRLFFRKWPVLLVSCALLTAGMVEIIFVQAISSEIRTQFSAGELGEVQIVTRTGMSDELASVLGNDEIGEIRAIAANTGSTITPQYLRQAPLQEEDNDMFSPRAVVRSFEDLRALKAMGGTLISGRWPKPGADELLAGIEFTPPEGQEYSNLLVKLDNRSFRIVGTFDPDRLPFGSELIGETSQTRTGNSNWSSVWLKTPQANRSRLATLLEDQLKGSVELHDGRAFFQQRYEDSRQAATTFSIALVVAVALATIAAFASTMEILISTFRREFDIMYLTGIDKRELTGSLILIGSLQGLIAALLALVLVAAFVGNSAFEVPVGNQNFLISPAIDLVSASFGLAISSLAGALGMLVAGRKIGRMSSGR